MRLRRRAFTAMLRQEMGWFDQPANRYFYQVAIRYDQAADRCSRSVSF